jgi:hypothetical protein
MEKIKNLDATLNGMIDTVATNVDTLGIDKPAVEHPKIVAYK